MALSISNKKILDPVRNRWVSALPEEIVRQKLLLRMIAEWGFPRAHLAVEKELKELISNSRPGALPERRVDIVCFTPDFAPLLLIECKEKLNFEAASEQLFGYNQFIQAPFLLLADELEVRFCYQTLTRPRWLSFLPTYKDLMHALRG